MSDNVAITAGSGTSIATDDVSSVHYQRVKLDLGADGAAAPVVGAMPIVGTVPTVATATWDSTTALNTSLTLDVRGYGSVAIAMQTDAGSFTNGVLTFKSSADTSVFVTTPVTKNNAGTLTSATIQNLDVSQSFIYHLDIGGLTHVRVQLTTAIVGTGTATITMGGGTSDSPVSPISGSVTVGSGSITATQVTASSLNAAVVGSIAHDSPISSQVPVTIAGRASAAAPSDVSADGDVTRIWTLRNGAQATVVTAAGALIGGDATNGLDVDVTRVTGTVTVDGSGVTQPVSIAAMPALVASSANIGDVDVVSLPAPLATSGGGTEVGALRVTIADDSTGTLSVDDGGGTISVDDGGNVLSIDDNAASLTVDAPVATPVFVRLSDGAAAITTLPVSLASVPSHAVTNAGTFATQNTSVAGVAVTSILCVKHTTITTAVTDAAIITEAAGNKIAVTSITATLDNASTVFPTLLVGFGAANTPTTTGVILAHGGVPAGGGVSRGDGSGVIGIGAANDDLRVTTTGNATGNGLQIVVTYYLVA